MKTMGVIGGLGPMATAYFIELLTGMTDVESDQQHIPFLLQSIPATPDRTAYILDHKRENPLPELLRAGRSLKEQGAEYLAIPCVTAHYFYRELQEELEIPVISLLEETAAEFERQQADCVGLLATSGTIGCGILQEALAKKGIDAVTPQDGDQVEIMNIIYQQIKAGRPVDIEGFKRVSQHLRERGAKRLLLGCTELSLIKRDFPLEQDYTDVLEILAAAAIRFNDLPVKEYRR